LDAAAAEPTDDDVVYRNDRLTVWNMINIYPSGAYEVEPLVRTQKVRGPRAKKLKLKAL